MKIVFTRHASVDKVAMLKKHKFIATRKFIASVINNPEDEDVVYKQKGDIITVITFYPARRGRYF